MTDGFGERTRKPVPDDLPADLRALLVEMERWADDRGLAFPKVLDLIYEAGGGRYGGPRLTTWRAGTAFPPEPAVRAWAVVCGGDVDQMMALYEHAKAAYAQRRKTPQAPAGPEPPGKQPRRRIATAAVLLVVSAGAAFWGIQSSGSSDVSSAASSSPLVRPCADRTISPFDPTGWVLPGPAF